ncbi:peptidase M56 [Flavobacterium cheongpyeongense]|uniref:Peptidase M56 n=1 Tax=Flavobacterium cheongpyeongense TaxID=2212651 RepID=A0A2V4BQJ5_9FLAO|nr:M56 family metallopeptidase [Flavobacterium cheongpyeongense]PXY41298.1 peptidase M56 [Flavobacterium cheongpyeongense]
MEAIFIYIAKSSGLIILFYCAYYFLLGKETFFNSNRWFLLSGLVTSVVMPFFVYTKIIWIDPVTVPNLKYSQSFIPQTIPQESFEINWNYILISIYCIGFIALLIKFAADFYSLNSVLKGKKIQQQADFKFVDISENIAPFSYFDYIVYNSSMYTTAELENIIEHEKVHSDQNHTVDVLISRFFCVLFWFNPIIWLYKKAILQNLEFIADKEAAKKISNKKAYQYTLLKITTHENCVAITNHFYQSLIKKRIVMLNKNQSKKRNYWKYYAILPALVAFILLFQIKTIAQEKNETKKVSERNQSVDVYKIKNTTTDAELKEITKKLKEIHHVDIEISEVKRNSNNQLTAIKVDIEKGTGQDQTIQIEGNEPIKSCGIVIATENGSRKINLVTDGGIDKPMVIGNRIVEVSETSSPDKISTISTITLPVPPTPPAFPTGPMPQAPAADMSKMPKPPVPPANPKDKVAMSKFEKEMAEFERKMESFEPDMSAYEKQIEEIMSKREAIFEKEMEKYEIAMEKFNVAMEKFTEEIQEKYGKNSEEYEINMKQYEKDMKAYEKNMKLQEKEMKKLEKENKRS